MLHSIRIEDLIKGNITSAFEYPQEIGHFSVDAKRKIHLDRSMMRYYVPPATNDQRMDLNVGYEDKPGMRDSSNRMDQLLKWIKEKRFEPVQNLSSASVDNNKSLPIVCLRGTIKKLLLTPCEQKNKWILCACRYKDVIYFRTDDEKVESQLYLSKKARQMIAWGYMFEQYMTAEPPQGIPNPSSSNHDQEEFCIVVTNKIGEHKLLMRTEVDGVNEITYRRRNNGDTSPYVEMKTAEMKTVKMKTAEMKTVKMKTVKMKTAEMKSKKRSSSQVNFQEPKNFKKYKSLQWWAQSVIVGIRKTICGLRNKAGIVQSIKEFDTDSLPACAQGEWSPQTCFNFCNNFLTYLKEFLVENDPSIVYEFHYNGGKDIRVSKRSGSGFQVLTEEFLLNAEEHYKNSETTAEAKVGASQNQ